MKTYTLLLVALCAFCNFSLSAQEFVIPRTEGMNWYRGNTHSHSSQDVGSGSSNDAVEVALWYKNHGYQFLIISDIIYSTKPDVISKVTDSSFLLIPGLENKSHFQSHWVHTNGLNTQGTIYPQEGGTLLETLQTDIDAIRALGGVPQIDHPRYMGGPDRETILASKDCTLMEVYNGYVGPKTVEEAGFLSTEMDWDYILAAGKQMFGLASDDDGKPGRGWVVVRATKLDAQEICRNLERGMFYASTGVRLKDIVIEPKRMTVIIDSEGAANYVTRFFGLSGRQLLATDENPAVFELKEDAKYVRAKITSSSGEAAWIQPVFIRATHDQE
jgi:hypothetical protein